MESQTDAPRQSAEDSPHRILVVDENSDLRLHYAFVLGRPGYHVDLAKDGAAGWVALQANNYSLLITEHDMLRLTGVELVRKLRAARMALPVVLVTGNCPQMNWPEPVASTCGDAGETLRG